jgi:ABC-type polysaccharide/polyol phosphate export permease
MSATFDARPSIYVSTARMGPRRLLREGWTDLLARRRLIAYLVRADVKKRGVDTILGNVWWILDPILQMIVYVIFISFILNVRQPDYPLFIFAAILPWKWFATSVSDAIVSVSSKDRLIKQLKFPKIVLPTAAVGAGAVSFAFGLVALAGLLILFYPERIAWTLVLIPVIAAVQLLFTFPIALVVAAMNVFYRDVGNLSRHVLRLWFYLSPALWGTALLEAAAVEYPAVLTLAKLNPFYWLFDAYRDVIYEGVPPDWASLVVVALVSLGMTVIALIGFKRAEPSFAKVL